MDYARQQRDPKRHLIGFSVVVLIHALVIWALVTGLARKAIEVIKKPLNATIIEEIKAPPPPPPPPPPKKVVEQPKVQPPPDVYVPPPDIPPPATSTAPVISAVTATPPAEPPVIAPPAPVAPPAPPAPPARPAVRKGVACSNAEKPSFPREANRAGIKKGVVNALVSIDEKGNVIDVQITSSDPPRVFDRVVKETLAEWKGCTADGSKYQATIEVNFRLTDD